MTFFEEIETAYQNVDLETLKSKAWAKWGDYLFITRYDEKQKLDDFHTRFLVLLDEKFDSLIKPLMENEVKTEFDEWYDNDEDASYETIVIQSLDIDNLDKGTWCIAFEDDNVDLLVHLYMIEWEFDYTGRTG